MSRHSIPIEDNIQVVVGYDPPLETYFVQVYDHSKNEDERVVYWAGALPTDKILTVEDLQKRISRYCEISPALEATLRKDKEEAPEPSPLQKRMRAMFE